MADYYTHIGFTITASKEEKDWIMNALRCVYNDDIPEELERSARCNDFDPDWDLGPMAISDAEGEKFRITFYTGETVDVEVVATLLQAFLRKFSGRRVIGFTYANLCSKARSGGFGGGAMVITKDNLYDMDAFTWMKQTIEELEESS